MRKEGSRSASVEAPQILIPESYYLPVVGFGPAVGKRRELGAEAVKVVKVERREGEAVAVRARGEDRPPGVHYHGPSVGPATVGLPAPLCGRDHKRLILNRPRPEQQLPVILAGLQGERRRDRQNLGAAQRQETVQLWETHVVADREAQGGGAGFGGHDLLARRDVRALQVL